MAGELTAAELRVLALVELTNRQIAARLGLSPKTVQNHMDAIRRKWGVENRTQMAVEAIRRGHLDLYPAAEEE